MTDHNNNRAHGVHIAVIYIVANTADYKTTYNFF